MKMTVYISTVNTGPTEHDIEVPKGAIELAYYFHNINGQIAGCGGTTIKLPREKVKKWHMLMRWVDSGSFWMTDKYYTKEEAIDLLQDSGVRVVCPILETEVEE